MNQKSESLKGLKIDGLETGSFSGSGACPAQIRLRCFAPPQLFSSFDHTVTTTNRNHSRLIWTQRVERWRKPSLMVSVIHSVAEQNTLKSVAPPSTVVRMVDRHQTEGSGPAVPYTL